MLRTFARAAHAATRSAAASSSRSALLATPRSSPARASLHISVRRCSPASPSDIDAALRSDPAMRALLADPVQRAMLSQLFSNPAQLEIMLGNPMIKSMLRSKPGGEQMVAMMEDPAQRAAMMAAIRSGAVEQMVGELGQKAQQMEKSAAVKEAEIVAPTPTPIAAAKPDAAKPVEAKPAPVPTPASTPVAAPAKPAAAPAVAPTPAAASAPKPVAAAAAPKQAAAPSSPVPRYVAPAPSSPVNRKQTAPVTASPPSPPTPAATAPSQDPALAAALSDPRLAGMLSNPAMRAALDDPRIAELLSNPTAASEKLTAMLSNPLMRMAASKMIPGMDDMLKQMDAQTPEQRAAMMERMKDGQMMSAVVAKAKEQIKSQEAAAAAAEKQAAPTAAAAAKTQAQAQAAAKPSIAAASGSGSGSGANKPPPPPTAAPAAVAASSSKPASPRSWVDLLFGIGLGILLFNLFLFLSDHPDVIDEVVKAAGEDEMIKAQLGSPLKEPWGGITWSGNVTDSNAQLVVPVQGPKGSGVLHARAFFDGHSKSWKLMLLQATLGSQPESAQKHSLLIPDRLVIKPRYVSPEEAERIRAKYEAMQRAMAEKHGLPPPKPLPRMDQPTPAPTPADANAAAPATAPAAARKKSSWWPF